MKNNQKIIIVTTVAALVALILDALMFLQHGMNLADPAVWLRLLLFIGLALLVDALSFLQLRFCAYATVLINLYFAIASLAAFQSVSPRTSAYGLFVQAFSIFGILVGAAGIYYGVKQRSEYNQARIEKIKEQMKNENDRS